MTLDREISTAIRRAALGLVVLFVIVVILGIAFRAPLELAAAELVEGTIT